MDANIVVTEPTYQLKKIKFHGNASEYFRIWIVNVVLTVLTLGIYSAWAKVRTRKYFYGNAELEGSRFDYHADPIKILKGRILMGVIFIAYSFGGQISPMIALAAALVFAAIMPWLMVRAMIFNLSQSSYRNIRFGFKKDYKESYLTYLKGFLVTLFSLGLAFPYAAYFHSHFRLNRIRFGQQWFKFKEESGPFFRAYYTAFGIYFVGVLIAIAITAVIGKLLTPVLGGVVSVIAIYSVLIFAGAFLKSALVNINSKVSLGEVTVEANLNPMELFKIYITNLVACIFTLGLAIPWALIRALNYRLENTTFAIPSGEIEKVQAAEGSVNADAKADAIADFWDFDLGL